MQRSVCITSRPIRCRETYPSRKVHDDDHQMGRGYDRKVDNRVPAGRIENIRYIHSADRPRFQDLRLHNDQQTCHGLWGKE
jgi:hypothetical protein